ncbi:MAG: hypothetical protein ACYCVL_13200 [Gemmatimonadaceae bacterium]
MARASAAVMRLAPSAFPQLPIDVRRELESRRCMVPQPPAVIGDTSADAVARNHAVRENVVRGQFFEKGTYEWAVLCSVAGVTAVWIVPEDDFWEITQLRAAPDTQWVAPDGQGSGNLSTTLFLYAAARVDLGQATPALDAIERKRARHDGLLFAYTLEGDGQPVYWTGRRWVALPGYD